MNWPKCSRQLCVLLGGIRNPILQAPMAGIQFSPKLAIAVANGGGLGSIPCAMLTTKEGVYLPSINQYPILVRAGEDAMNEPALPDPGRPENEQGEEAKETMARMEEWRQKLKPFYAELEIPWPEMPKQIELARKPIDDEMCSLVEMLRPRVVSFHFGMPKQSIIARIKRIGATILCSATTLDEAKFLEMEGVDAIIAQGAEAGGHRGIFLGNLEEMIVDNVRIPVIAAGGIVDGKGISAALAIGASGVQIGTAFMFASESECPLPHKRQLMDIVQNDGGHRTAFTNLLFVYGKTSKEFDWTAHEGTWRPNWFIQMGSSIPLGILNVVPTSTGGRKKGQTVKWYQKFGIKIYATLHWSWICKGQTNLEQKRWQRIWMEWTGNGRTNGQTNIRKFTN